MLERLNDLSQSVAKKIDEIEEMEALLKDKDKIIEIMNMKIRDKQKRPVFQLPKGLGEGSNGLGCLPVVQCVGLRRIEPTDLEACQKNLHGIGV